VNGNAGVDKGGNDEIYMWQDQRFRTTGTYVIPVVRNGTYRFSVGEALNNTATGMQRKIRSIRNQFILYFAEYTATFCVTETSNFSKLH
jgi:hypothetical protein